MHPRPGLRLRLWGLRQGAIATSQKPTRSTSMELEYTDLLLLRHQIWQVGQTRVDAHREDSGKRSDFIYAPVAEPYP